MRKPSARRCAILVLLLYLAAGLALGESGHGDLEERFSNVPRMEYAGKTYYLRDRMTTILVAGILPDEAGVPRADFAALFAIDDNEKRIAPVYIDGAVMVEVEGRRLPLREVYALGEDPNEDLLRMAAAVNGMFGVELINDYMGVDLDGVSAVTELGRIEGDARQRLHLLRLALEAMPSKQLNELYGVLSEYLITDMKSGAVMRALDKADRYEVAETVDLPTIFRADELLPDEAAIQELAIGVFYEDSLF